MQEILKNNNNRSTFKDVLKGRGEKESASSSETLIF